MALRKLSQIRGDSQTLTITMTHDGVPYCIKNWAVFFTIKKSYDLPDSQAALQKIVTTFSDTTGGTTGVATISIDPEDTVDLEPGEYDFDIQVRTSDEETFTVMRGKYEIEYDVTRTPGTAGTAA